MRKRIGALIWDALNERFDIRFRLEEYYGGLHCGDCLEVKVNSRWRSTRIEMK